MLTESHSRRRGVLFAAIVIVATIAVGVATGAVMATDGSTYNADISQQLETGPPDVEMESADDGIRGTHTVELVTGHTVTVANHGEDTEILGVKDPEGGVATDIITSDTEDGMFVVPNDPSIEMFSEDLFNVELLIEQGLTADEVDGIPVIVSYEEGTDSAQMQTQSATVDGFSPDQTFEIVDAQAGTLDPDAERTLSTLTGASAIEQVRLDAPVETQLDETADIINAPAARNGFDVDGENVTAAIIDSGIDADHPDFGDRIIEQVDFTDDGTGDRRGHGTHVAGIAAGDGTESDGEFTGIAPGVDVLDLKALDDSGSGTFSDIISAIEYAVDEEADIISMSLGGAATEDDDLTEAAEEAVDEGAHVVISAGNEGDRDSVTSPGQAEGAITVGAYDQSEGDTIAFFSSGGPTADTLRIKPNVVAPGWSTTAPGSDAADEFPYTDKAGTSMSAPHVTGLVALMLQDNPELSSAEAKSRIASTASHVPDEEADDVFMQGTGLVDAERALDPSLGIDDPFVSFGNYEDPTNDTDTVVVENLDDETLELDVNATLQNIPDNQQINDQISTNETTITLEPGETAAVEIEINTEDAFGENSGIVTFETQDGAEYRTAVGFVKAIELDITWERHPDANGAFDFGLMGATSHDGTFSFGPELMFGPGTESFRVPAGEANVTADVAVADGIPGEPGHLYPSNTSQIDQENSELIVRDEDTVRVDFDEEPLPDEGPFLQSDFHLTMHNTLEESARTSRLNGENMERTVWVSPTDPDSIAMPAIETIMLPEEDYLEDPDEYGVDSLTDFAGETKYHLFLTLDDVEGPEDEISIDDPEQLATEQMGYNRFNADRSYLMGPGLFMANETLGSFSRAQVRQLSANETGPFDQTIYINEEARYSQRWNHLAGVGSDADAPWEGEREHDLIPEPGAEYEFDFNEHPLTGQVVSWQMDPLASFQVDPRVAAYGDGDAVLGGSWTPDEDLDRHIVIRNGEEIINETTTQDVALSQATWDDELEDGDTYEVIIEGNSLWATEERVVPGPTLAEDTYSSWEATYEPDTANAPPNIDVFHSPAADASNMVAQSMVPFHLEFETDGVGLDEVTAYASMDGPDHTPFDDDQGWTELEVENVGELTYEFAADGITPGDELSVAVAAVDEDGNELTTTTWDALYVPPSFERTGQSGTVLPTESASSTFEVGDLSRVKTELHEDSAVAPENLTLHHDGTEAAFGEWTDLDEPVEAEEFAIDAVLDRFTFGEIVLEHTFESTEGHTVTYTTGPSNADDTGVIAGIVTDRDTGEPVEGVTIAGENTDRATFETTSNEEGYYVSERPLVPDQWVVNPVDAPDGYTTEAIVQANIDEATVVNFEVVPEESTITGTVVDESGDPVEDARVFDADRGAFEAFTDEAGEFEINSEAFERGDTVAVRADAENYEKSRIAVLTLDVGTNDVSMELGPARFQLGDVTRSGEVTIEDAVAIQRYSLGLDPGEPFDLSLADVNGDGEVTIADAVLAQRISLGLAAPSSLVVADVDAPTSAGPGETIEVTATVENEGDVAATEEVEFRFAEDDTFETVATTTVEIGGAGTDENVATASAEFSVPEDLEPGEYEHGVFVDDHELTEPIDVTD